MKRVFRLRRAILFNFILFWQQLLANVAFFTHFFMLKQLTLFSAARADRARLFNSV